MRSNDEIMRVLRSKKFKPSKAKKLSRMLGIPQEEYVSFKHALSELSKEGHLIRLPRNRYALADSCGNLITGKIQVVRNREYGFLVPDDREKHPDDIYVSCRDLRGAMDGDRVLVRLKKSRNRKRRGRLETGVVEKILKRRRSSFVGVLERRGGRFYITSPTGASTTLPQRFIPLARSDVKNSDVGNKVIVKLPEEQNPQTKVFGEIVKVLGKPLEPEVEEQALLAEFAIEDEIPEDATAEEKAILDEDWRQELEKREDLRGLLSITIDPTDAYDFDDSIYVKRESHGYSLMVHIADVSYFVKEGTALDKLAEERLNSIYLPALVIPMLPEGLTKEVCCLSEGKERLAKTVSMKINLSGEVEEVKIFRSAVKSRRRLDYETAEEMIDNKAESRDKVCEMLKVADELAGILKMRRLRRGAIDMEIPEPKVIIADDGSVRDILFERRPRSYGLIEEFMLLANQKVAEFLKEKKVAFIRRIHEPPDNEAMSHFAAFAESLGLEIQSTKIYDIQRLLRSVAGKPLSYPINYALLRSMKRALYTTKEMAHFALSLDNYTHFTSPIRRYVDLTVHRALDAVLDKKSFPRQKIDAYLESLETIAGAASDKEELTDRLEREFLKLKACYLLKGREGETFDGLIVSVSERAFWVLLSRPAAEGVVPERLFKEQLIFEPSTFTLTAKRMKRSFRIGQKIKVRLVSVDIPSRTILLFPV
ncbi:MAG: VacB/RNase II family 3'-5' exoribonuclease [Planctomycetota bacterium]|nr:VacB/RNase II family 3'-5' exoribonuclease [Planctomycetota bacterium]